MEKIGVALDVVVVTYNRLTKLKTALSCYENQTSSFRNLIVVNNCSNDGTREFLDTWKSLPSSFNKVVIHANDNLGGSGGFYLGQKTAMDLKADWVFVADDDAYVSSILFYQFYSFLVKNDTENFSAICSSVRFPDGEISAVHRSYWAIRDGRYPVITESSIDDYKRDSFPIDLLSYVGSFIKVSAMRAVGLVNPRYFIFYDDTEHSLRLRTVGDILCIPEMVVIHDTVPTINSDVSWRTYYATRNNVHMQIRNLPFLASVRFVISFIVKRGTNLSSDPQYLKLYRRAVWHAVFGRLGKDTVYAPGKPIPSKRHI